MTDLVYRVMSSDDWDATLRTGIVPRCGADERDGYVHLSTADTVVETANLYFEPDENPVVAEVVSAALGAALRWEVVADRGGACFPHLYSEGIPLSTIRGVISLRLDADGFALGHRRAIHSQASD